MLIEEIGDRPIEKLLLLEVDRMTGLGNRHEAGTGYGGHDLLAAPLGRH